MALTALTLRFVWALSKQYCWVSFRRVCACVWFEICRVFGALALRFHFGAGRALWASQRMTES